MKKLYTDEGVAWGVQETENGDYYDFGRYGYDEGEGRIYLCYRDEGEPLLVSKRNYYNFKSRLSGEIKSDAICYGSKPYLKLVLDDGNVIGMSGDEVFIESKHRDISDWGACL